TVRPLQRNLGILLAVGDEERDSDALDDAVEVDAFGNLHEFVDIFRSPDPAYVSPVVRDGEVAFAFAPPLLDIAPVMVRAPRDAAGESRLERDGTRTKVPAERHSL